MKFEGSFLERFAINLTQVAKDSKLDPIIGRDEEVRNVIRILSRKNKNNPVLIGSPGVGKTAIVEGLAQRIVNNEVPNHLRNKELYSLDLGQLVAGAKFQGEFEERLKGIMEEVKKDNDKIILFIDEIHMLIGMGKTSGAMDGANLLKPMLARGELNCIGATTLTEYKENIEKDAAFERRFQKVLVNEPTVDESINILRGLKFNLEAYHGVRIEDEALISAAKLSDRYITERFLPDKAIDLVDEAAANLNVQLNSQPEELEQMNRRIVALEIETKALKGITKNKEKYQLIKKELKELKEKYEIENTKWEKEKNAILKQKELKEKIKESERKLAVAKNNLEYEKAAEIEYSILPNLQKELEAAKNTNTESNFIQDIVTPEEIYKIISRLTQIPLENLQKTTKEKLLNLESELNSQVIGQDKAVKEIANAIIRNRMNLSNPDRPIGSFLFVGSTGVGKTEVSKVLASKLFDDRKKMFRIDMSEYMEKHSVSRLIGAPPGYVGFEEGGKLTEYIRTNPYSIVLFDEIEKAHPEVLNVLLQILDDGHVTDSKGRNVNFKNTIIIMTSNIGSDIIIDKPDIDDDEIMSLLKNHLKPEFINRIDSIIKFNPMNKEMYETITKNILKDLIRRLNEEDITVEFDDSLIDYIYDKSFVKEFGARPIKRFIQSNIENEIAYELLKSENKNFKIIIKNNQIVIN